MGASLDDFAVVESMEVAAQGFVEGSPQLQLQSIVHSTLVHPLPPREDSPQAARRFGHGFPRVPPQRRMSQGVSHHQRPLIHAQLDASAHGSPCVRRLLREDHRAFAQANQKYVHTLNTSLGNTCGLLSILSTARSITS